MKPPTRKPQRGRKRRMCWVHRHRYRGGSMSVETEFVGTLGITSDQPPGSIPTPCDKGDDSDWCKGWELMREVSR